jgi:hypothetical protein
MFAKLEKIDRQIIKVLKTNTKATNNKFSDRKSSLRSTKRSVKNSDKNASTFGNTDLSRTHNKSVNKASLNNHGLWHYKSTDSLISQSYSTKFGGSLNRSTSSLNIAKQSTWIKDMKKHEETHSVYRTLASKYNNSSSKRHKIKAMEILSKNSKNRNITSIKSISKVLPEIKAQYTSTKIRIAKEKKCILQDSESIQDKVVEKTSMTENEKQISKNIDIYTNQSQTSRVNKLKATLANFNIKSSEKGDSVLIMNLYSISPLANYGQKIKKNKYVKLTSRIPYKKSTTISRSRLKSIEEEDNKVNIIKQNGAPTKCKSVYKTNYKVI